MSLSVGNEDNGASVTVKQTIVESLEAPRLTGIDVKDFVRFRELRSIYERKLAEHNRDQNKNVPRTTLRNSISNDLLRMFIRIKWVPETDIEEISDESLIQCINNQAIIIKRDFRHPFC